MTGSVNQLGRVQVVGGINEKIEGFYEVCKERGLDGSHAVIIPEDNVKHLMLDEEVVDAVAQKLFTVYAVRYVDEAIEVLTGKSAGSRSEDGQFPKDTVNRLVEDKLVQYASKRQRFAEGGGGDKRQD